MTSMDPILELREVTRRYDRATAVNAASFSLRAGRTACLLGPSGCGKSTLLRMIAGLEPVNEGEIRIAGQTVAAPGTSVAPEDRGVGLVFQDNALFPHLSVRDNVGFGLRKLSTTQRETEVSRLLDQLHIGHLAGAWPHRLSGGEQQRVAIARALSRKPSLLLLDEPFSSMDGFLRESIRDALLADLRRTQATVLIVTHDPDEAMAISNDLILMAGGNILQAGTPQDCYRHPANVTAARLLGEIVLLPGSISGGRMETALGAVPASRFPDGPAQLGLRPEALYQTDDGIPGIVRDVRFAGDQYRVLVDIDAIPIALRISGQAPQRGDTVRIGFNTQAAHIFAGQGR